MTPFEMVMSVYKKEGSKVAIEFYNSLSDDERKQSQKQLAEIMGILTRSWRTIEEYVSYTAPAIVDWWEKIPAETREALAEKAKDDDRSTETK
jgi:hypothetical protein